MKRRLLVLGLAAALFDPLGHLARVWSHAGHECTDHVCACARSAKKQCHESEASAGLQASCNHDSAAVLGLVMPAVPAVEVALEVTPRDEPADAPPGEQAVPGFLRIDSPPPRSL